ncbi:uncharacterized protein JN550_005535 [Neoarthrinium moseri]|uniref:uncharacterized protein n=1 Tax=Neoarthrinium moseri TaxID=1658444 RepID=UPI001FDE1716|nr:uncharacterized protein JN550_005535 [Neoarthrinium moseri]KAI1869945.1 hypothetical protein JN550_005535 [Neoarthrinium moseri]
MEEPIAQRIDPRCPICHKSYADDKNRANMSRIVAKSAGLVQCLEERLVMNAYERRFAATSILRAALGARPEATPVLIKVVLCGTQDNLTLSLDEFQPDVTAPLIDTISGNMQIPYAAIAWNNEALETQVSRFLDSMPLNEEYYVGIDVEPERERDELQCVPNSIPAAGHSRQLSPSMLASIPYQDPSFVLERRDCSEPELELTGDLALHILRSYVRMIADRDSLPPFVHPKYQNFAGSNTSRPSPLYAAITLAKMLYLGCKMDKTLIWRLIRMEQERLLNDHPKFNKWELLEALQSLIVYILMRITEGRHDYTNFDTQLLISVNTICRHITTKLGMLVSFDELEGEMMSWEEWVFYESRRRSATIFLIIDSILHARIADPAPSMPEYTSSPAPCPSALWVAESERDWTVNYAGHLQTNAALGMLTNGDLVALKEAAGEQHDRWYAYADSFGLLVTLAANLII